MYYLQVSILIHVYIYYCFPTYMCIGPRDDSENGHRRPIRRQVFLPRRTCDTPTSAWGQLSGGPGGIVLG